VPQKLIRLSQPLLREAVEDLTAQEPRFAGVVAEHGLPPIRDRPPGFATLVHIILEQQVSLASAQATLDRLKGQLGQITPEGVLALDDKTLRTIGFSRQKASYVLNLAESIQGGGLRLDGLGRLGDDQVRECLVALKGIGNWTADIYLLMALRRPDVWPVGDLALAVAAQRLFELPTRPSPAQLGALAQPWRPWRSVAAKLLWLYLEGRG
jgi:DNA-3-methyladenine glycosylase II